MGKFESKLIRLGPAKLPTYSGVRIMMMPLIVGDLESIPRELYDWRGIVRRLWFMDFTQFGAARDSGKVCYLTIDEKFILPGQTHRRAGLHVDGIYQGRSGGWGGGPGGGWSSKSTGAITVSSHVGCRAWLQSFNGYPGPEGECDHLASQCRSSSEVIFEPHTAYWFDGLCVHESITQSEPVARQFVRLSLPSNSPWFEGYTENPLGICPTGDILPRRQYMDV